MTSTGLLLTARTCRPSTASVADMPLLMRVSDVQSLYFHHLSEISMNSLYDLRHLLVMKVSCKAASFLLFLCGYMIDGFCALID